MAALDAITSLSVQLAHQWPYVLCAVLACAVASFLQVARSPDPLADIPLLGAELADDDKRRESYTHNARRLLFEGAKKFKNKAYRVPARRAASTIVVDASFLKELKNLPEDTVDFTAGIIEIMHSKWTKGQSYNDVMRNLVIKKRLTPALARLNPTIADEVARAFRDEFPECNDWTKIPVMQKTLRVITKVAGRVFVGPELCLSEEYIDHGINYTLDMFAAVYDIRNLKPNERDAKAPSLPAVMKLDERRRRAATFLKPIIQARKKIAAEDDSNNKPDDMLQWLIEEPGDFDDMKTVENLTDIQLSLTLAATHTTSSAITSSLYTLAAYPQYIPELREEVRNVLNEHGTFTTAAVQSMRKLDSFLREVMRVFPFAYVGFLRKVVKPFTLSNGQQIPAGSFIEVAIEVAHAAQCEEPEKFDPWRSYRIREQAEMSDSEHASAVAANQTVSVTPSNLTFGYGRHACPGRFFAVNEIKMVVGRAILEFDMKMEDGSHERYPDLVIVESASSPMCIHSPISPLS